MFDPELSDNARAEPEGPRKKGGEGSDDSPTEWAGPSEMFDPMWYDYKTAEPEGPRKFTEQRGGKGSDDSPAEWASPFEKSEPPDRSLEFQELSRSHLFMRSPFYPVPSDYETTEPARSLKLIEERGGMGSDDSYETSKTSDQESSGYGSMERERSPFNTVPSDYETTEPARSFKLIQERGGKGSDDSPTEWARRMESKKLERVLLDTRRLTVGDRYGYRHMYTPSMLKRGRNTVLSGDAELKLHVVQWMSTDDETRLELRDANFCSDLISILALLCPAVEHISFDFFRMDPHQFTHKPMHMRAVITVCIKFVRCNETLHEILLAVSKSFTNAESLDLQVMFRNPYNKAYRIPAFNSSSLRELILRYDDRSSDEVLTDSLFLDISTSCRNIVSLVLSGFGIWLSNKSGKDMTSWKMQYLTNIHLEPFGTEYCYPFETLTNVLHVVHVISPCLKFVEAKKVQLGGGELASVKWSRTSSGYVLQHEGASAVVPMADLMHLVSNELKGVTVLTFDRCTVDIPQSIGHPPQSTGEESSLRELKFSNVECPLSPTDIHKLSEMFPNLKITVEHESQASQEDSKQGAGMPFKPERKTSPSSSPSPTSSIDELVGATARVQVHKEQTDTQNTEEEGKEEEEEYHIAMESLPHETDEVNVKPIKMECCERVGVEGGKLLLDSFGIELEIPPGAIDSEAPQDISLRVLADTPNLGNNKEEMSVCFGVQCLAPDDLVLKLPVTYTIPHCAVVNGTRYSRVEAVLYTGEGEYSPDAVVKERIILSGSGIPSFTIRKDVLQLKINHFSWAKIKLRIKNIFLRGKKMCCWPFKENNLALQRTSSMLHAHLYDAIKGNSELVESKEVKYNFIPAVMEQEVLIQPAEGHLKMTCYVEETVVKEPVVSLDKLMSGTMIYEPFKLDFTDHSDGVAVSLEVGQNKNLEVNFLFQLEDRRDRASPQDQGQVLQGEYSSHEQRTSRGTTGTGETQENRSGKQDDFEKKLTTVARNVATRVDIDNLRKALGLRPGDVQHYVNDNNNSSYMATLSMLLDWRKKQTKAKECEALKVVLEEAGQTNLADELFGTS